MAPTECPVGDFFKTFYRAEVMKKYIKDDNLKRLIRTKMDAKIKDDVLNNRTTAIIFPVKDYPAQINEFVKILGENFAKILYVSLNRLYNPLKRKMQQDGVNLSKFMFVDCVTKTAVAQPEEHDDCIYVSSPSALTEISIAITKKIQQSYPDIILFDSLSTLLIYENTETASQFLHSLVNKINAFGISAAFTILEGEKEQPLITDLNMIMDKVIKIGDNPPPQGSGHQPEWH